MPLLNGTRPDMGRRAFLAALAGTAGAVGLAACSSGTQSATVLSATAPLPTALPGSTELAISIITTQLALQASGQLSRLPFKVSSWPNISAGPDVITGFRAHSIDLASNAGIPPIQAHSGGVQAKIVSVGLSRKPIYKLATAPGSGLTSVSQFRGKKLAFSQGQAQGVVLLRALQQAGISLKDVDLVALTSDEFLTALEANQVDVAPLGEPTLTQYLNGFAKKGAGAIYTPVVDLLQVLWAPTSVLEDPAKAAAIRAFIPFYAQAQVWIYEHPQQWLQTYYVGNQHLSAAKGQLIIDSASKPYYPTKWDSAIAWEQQTADLLAAGGYDEKFDVSELFDRRFEGLAASAVPATYRS
jgi:sulfonate transport system substrate-binding protein